jgi:hypothetical protein
MPVIEEKNFNSDSDPIQFREPYLSSYPYFLIRDPIPGTAFHLSVMEKIFVKNNAPNIPQKSVYSEQMLTTFRLFKLRRSRM